MGRVALSEYEGLETNRANDRGPAMRAGDTGTEIYPEIVFNVDIK